MFRHRFDVGTMLRVLELNVKNPAFAQQKIAQMRRVFFEELQDRPACLGNLSKKQRYK